MKKISRVLSYLVASLSVLTLVRARGGWGAVVLWVPKLLAGAWAPFLTLAGGLGALMGLVCGDRAAALAGLCGAAVAARHVARVTAPHDGFDRAFGPDWRSRIPTALRSRMLPRRYAPLLRDLPVVPRQRDVVIGAHAETGDPLLADVWLPPERVPHTGLAVIYLHGSCWHYGAKDVYTRRFFRHLAGQGHVVVDVAYTLAPRAQLEGMVADVKRAIAWTKAHAAGYGVNPQRVVLMGGSAGGQLALLAAYTPHHPRLWLADVDVDLSVRAVVSYYGPPDLQASHGYFQTVYGRVLTGTTRLERRCLPLVGAVLRRIGVLPPGGRVVGPVGFLPDVLGGTPEEVPACYRLGSPVEHVGPHCPPTLLLQGGHDLGGMVADVRRLYRALRAAGVPAVYVEFPATEHSFDLFSPRWSPAAHAATYDVDRFLALMV